MNRKAVDKPSANEAHKASVQSIWKRLKSGERVILSDELFDALVEHFHSSDGPDADPFFGCLASIPNPKRVGVYDQYLAWIKVLAGPGPA